MIGRTSPRITDQEAPVTSSAQRLPLPVVLVVARPPGSTDAAAELRNYVWVAWIFLSFGLGVTLFTIVMMGRNIYLAGLPGWTISEFVWGPLLVANPIVALLILRRHPHHRVGWVIAWAGFVWMFCQLTYGIGALGLPAPNFEAFGSGIPVAVTADWRPDVVVQFGFFYPVALYLLLVELLLIFPSGRLASAGWVWARIVGIVGALGASYLVGFGQPWTMNGEFGPVLNPFHLATVPGLIDRWLGGGFYLIFAMGVPAGISMIVRLLRAEGIEREQLKLIAWNTGFVVAAYALHLYSVNFGLYERTWGWIPNSIWGLALNSIAIVVGLAILRHHLYDIDVVVRRTILYTLLTGAVIGLYLLLANILIYAFDRIGGLDNRRAITLAIVTVAIAFMFQPLRNWLQGIVNRMFFGDRDDPNKVLNRLGEQLEASLAARDVLPMVATVAGEALKIPYVGVALMTQNGELRVVTEHGHGSEPLIRFPMVYQRERVGELLVSPRSLDESFSRADRLILESLARQAAVAAHAVKLNDDLQLARQRLVNAREEERLRLRRDLHDGLGAQLAALAIQAGGIRRLVNIDADRAESEIAELQLELRKSIGDIRSLVHGMRPPALDELGLVGALRARIVSFQTTPVEDSRLTIGFSAPTDLQPLPAAVEVAVYRVVEEGLTNMARHAHARHGHVSLAVEKEVRLTIDDDGRGMPTDVQGGIGLASMRERAAELGGSFRIEASAPRGIRLTLILPLIEAIP